VQAPLLLPGGRETERASEAGRAGLVVLEEDDADDDEDDLEQQ